MFSLATLRHRPAQKKSGLDSFAIFSFFWAVALLFHVIQTYSINIYLHHSIPHIAFLVSCLALLVYPRSVAFFLICSLMVVIIGWHSFPRNISNHFIIEFLFCVGVISYCFLQFYLKKAINLNRHSIFYFSSALGRWLLIILYFFGVFHKLNVDWFDPNVSCASKLWGSFFWRLPTWLENHLWAKNLAIYGTLVLETAIIAILIASPRMSKIAILIGLFFHGVIGLNAYAQYWNFSTLSFALHCLFIPKSTARLFRESTIYLFFCQTGYRIFALRVSLVSLFILISWFFYTKKFYVIYVFWVFFLIAILVFFFLFTKYHENYRQPIFSRKISRVAGVVALLFFLNGLSPYIGFKTESSIAMYSNLFTELGKTNHLLFDEPPYIFNFQNQVVYIRYSSDNRLDRFARRNQPILLHQLRQIVKGRYKEIKDDSIVYLYNGQIRSFNRIEEDELINEVNYLLYKLLVLKPIDVSQPKRCTH